MHDVRDILLVTNPQFNLGLVARRVEQFHSYKILDTVISLCFFLGIFPPLLHCCLHRTISFLPQFYTGLAKRCFARWLFQRVGSWLVDVFTGLAKRCFASPTSVVHVSRRGYCVDYRANAWTTGCAEHAREMALRARLED